MAQIITYPKLSTLANNDLLLVSDVSSVNKTTNSLEIDTLAQHVIVTNNVITGGGTVRQIPMFTPTGVIIGDSIMSQNAGGTEIRVGGSLNIVNDLTADRGSILDDLSVGTNLSVGGDLEVANDVTVDNDLTVDNASQLSGNVDIGAALNVGGVAFFSSTVEFDDDVIINNRVADNVGSFGTAGQVLSSTGSGVQWTSDGGGTVTGTGTTQTLPLWTDGPNGVLGDSFVRQDTQAAGGNVYIQPTDLGSTANFEFGTGGSFSSTALGEVSPLFQLRAQNGGYYKKTFKFESKEGISIGRTSISGNVTLDVGDASDVQPAAWFRNGVVISNNPGGVQVDNTSLVIGAGNNDNISGSDHCLIVGSGNQITSNSDQSVAFGQGNTITGSTDALAVGNSNTITSSQRALSLGYNNDVNSASSFVAGGDNAVNGANTNMVLGFDHQVTNSQNFIIGNQLISDGNKMVLGYRNQTTYPTPNEPLGLGQTKFVVATGSSTTNDSNALLITEGGRQSGGVDQVPRIILPTVVNFNFADDTAAAAGGIPVGGLYHNAGALRIRLV